MMNREHSRSSGVASWLVALAAAAMGCSSAGPSAIPGAGGDAAAVDVNGSAAECAPGQQRCGAACVDVMASSTDCGRCGATCPAGQSCVGGTCVCAPGQLACNGICTNTLADVNHCGGCGLQCPAGAQCQAGQCVCQAGLVSCGGQCVNVLSNGSHCGACNQTCPLGLVCSGGQCATSCTVAGQAACGSSCVDVQSDVLNCGACGNTCAAGQTCTAGACTCPAGQSACNGACVDTLSNPQNCGGCGIACVAGQTCQNGACLCSSGLSLCGGQCVDIASDTTHCGGCGVICAAGQSCVAGACSGQTAATGGSSGMGGGATGGSPATGGTVATGTGGVVGTGGSPENSTACPTPEEETFSFFLLSHEALQRESGTVDGFGGDLGGLEGADAICQSVAEYVSACQSKKVWRAFLSTANPVVNAIDRIGQGPWHDRLGRLLANNVSELLKDRPPSADPQIINDFPNEYGVPNHDPDGTGDVDNHEILTGTGTDGKLYLQDASTGGDVFGGGGTTCGDREEWSAEKATCWNWTSSEPQGCPRVGHSWPRDISGINWISVWNEGGCAPGGVLTDTVNGGGPDGTRRVGSAGGYGGWYCFAPTP